MSDTIHWRIIPATTFQCWLTLLVGMALAASSAVTLASSAVRVPVLEVVVIILGVLMAICALIGLMSPGRRRR